MKQSLVLRGTAALSLLLLGCSGSVTNVTDESTSSGADVRAPAGPVAEPADPSAVENSAPLDAPGREADVSADDSSPVIAEAEPSTQGPTMDEILSELQVPPPWMDSVALDFDMSLPWNKAWDRIEVLLQTAQVSDRRQAIKLAYLYQQDGRARIGYPASVYFLAGEYAWAIREFAALDEKNSNTFLRMASCYLHFGQIDLALSSLEQAEQQITESPPWDTFRRGQVFEARGDVHAAARDAVAARECYQRALALYEQTELPANQQLAKNRGVTNLRSKLEMLDHRELISRTLSDGEFTGSVPGYSDTIQAQVAISDGKIASIEIQHSEKADLQSTRIIPERIMAQQDIGVDAISGATITSQAVRNAVFQALKQAAGIP